MKRTPPEVALDCFALVSIPPVMITVPASTFAIPVVPPEPIVRAHLVVAPIRVVVIGSLSHHTADAACHQQREQTTQQYLFSVDLFHGLPFLPVPLDEPAAALLTRPRTLLHRAAECRRLPPLPILPIKKESEKSWP